MDDKRLDKIFNSRVQGNIRVPGNSVGESYCDWDQRSHEKGTHNNGYDKGACNKPAYWKFRPGGQIDSEFIKGFAAAGGKIEDGIFIIEASKFGKVQELFGKLNLDRLQVTGSRRRPIGVPTQADWTKRCYAEESYGKCIGTSKGEKAFMELDANALNTLDKTAIAKLADSVKIVADGKMKIGREGLTEIRKKLDE